jgi:hypothetical protein
VIRLRTRAGAGQSGTIQFGFKGQASKASAGIVGESPSLLAQVIVVGRHHSRRRSLQTTSSHPTAVIVVVKASRPRSGKGLQPQRLDQRRQVLGRFDFQNIARPVSG